MGVLVVVLVIAAVIGAVLWNHKNQNEAMAGHQFEVASPPEAVVQALAASYCDGARAVLKGFVRRVKVTPISASSFRIATKIGDEGTIEVEPAQNGCIVRARTTQLHVGTHPISVSNRSTLWGFSSRLANLIYVALGISMNAARMKRFQRSIDNQVRRQLRRSARV